jgi:putative peptidoglycan lipid II flippase
MHDVQMSAASLAPYSAGLFGFIAVKVVVPAYYARQDTRTPVRIGIIAMFSNMLINVILAVVLVQMHYSAPHAGLALATSVAAFINAGLLYRGLRRSQIYQPLPGWRRLFVRVMLASLAMSAVLMLAIVHPEQWYQHRGITRAAWLALWVTLGALTYGAMLFLLGLRVRHLKGPEHPVTSPSATL